MRRHSENGHHRRERKVPGRRQIARILPVAFLGLSFGVAGLGALAAYRAQRSHSRTARAVLTDYGGFAAWSYERSLAGTFGSALSRSLRLPRQNPQYRSGAPTQERLSRLVGSGVEDGECTCQAGLGGGFAFYTRLGDLPPDAIWAGQPPDVGERVRMVDLVQHHARTVYQNGWPYAVLHTSAGIPIAYVRLSARDRGDDEKAGAGVPADTLIYGIELDRVRLDSLFEAALDDDVLLPPTLTTGRANQDVVQVDVVDPQGSVLFASRPNQPHAYPAEEQLPVMLGGSIARASVLPDVADRLIIGGLPESHAPTLLLIFGLAGALAVAAIIQLRREHRLALLRQDFVASVSHELRTPLAQVRLFTDTLRLGRTRSEDERSWALENIDRETLRLTHLVERILHFSRAERGVLPTERETVNVHEEVTDALAAFAPLVPATRARFESDVPEALMVEVNRDSLRQVLLNYLDNAVRYGPAGQTVRVVGKADGEVVRLAVEDEGPGVPIHERDAVFEPFRRGRGAVGTVVSGSGIGLSVVRQIATASGGQAWVEDAPGGGARFVFELPALHTARPAHFPENGPLETDAARAAGVEEDSEVA